MADSAEVPRPDNDNNNENIPPPSSSSSMSPPLPLPRVSIQFCTQCKWMLRAAYFAQELLSTFSTALGEVALQPSTGGVFVVTIQWHENSSSSSNNSNNDNTGRSSSGGDDAGKVRINTRVLWDRKLDGGFPETKELKRRVRDVIEPGRDLGHVDRHYPRAGDGGDAAAAAAATGEKVPSADADAATATPDAPSSRPSGEKPGPAEACITSSSSKCEDCS